MRNVLTKGAKILSVPAEPARSTEEIIINEDYAFVGEITGYDAGIGQVAVKKAWDQAASPKTFYAWAKYPGRSGTPPGSLVEIGAKVPVYRVGKTNINFSTVPEAFELHGPTNYSKASFVCFFFS